MITYIILVIKLYIYKNLEYHYKKFTWNKRDKLVNKHLFAWITYATITLHWNKEKIYLKKEIILKNVAYFSFRKF